MPYRLAIPQSNDGGPCRIRTYNQSLMRRQLYRWANGPVLVAFNCSADLPPMTLCNFCNMLATYMAHLLSDDLFNDYKQVADPEGVEPSSTAWQAVILTDIRWVHIWRIIRESNPLSLPWRGSILPLDWWSILVDTVGFGPATSRLSAECSNQLSYVSIGREGRSRTFTGHASKACDFTNLSTSLYLVEPAGIEPVSE